jgi:chromosome partitioning protein
MDIIAMVNEKGGTGKTTSSVNLAAALGEMGKKVLLVDLDGQAATTRWLGVEGDMRFAEALLAGKGLEPIRDIMPNVDLAPGHGKLDSVAHDLRPTQGGQLRKLLGTIKGYDYCLIDCPPSLGNRLIGNALLAATHALVPVETSVLALDGLKILLTTLEDIREGFGHDITLVGVLGCRYDGRTRLSRLVLEELQRALPNHLFHTVIRENVKMRECPASGQSILDYAGDSHGAEDYRCLAAETVRRLEKADPEEEACRESTESLRQAVSHLEEVAEDIEQQADGEHHIPDIDGNWSGIGQALATDKAVPDPTSQEQRQSPEVHEPQPEVHEPQPEPQPEPAQNEITCVEETRGEEDGLEDPPAQAMEAPDVPAEPEPEPQPIAIQPSAPAPRASEPVFNVQKHLAESESSDLSNWPAEKDVIQAEQAESQSLDTWPKSQEFEEPAGVSAQGGCEDEKKVPTWLRFFTGSRD